VAELVTESLTRSLAALKLQRTAEQLEALLQEGVSKQMTYAAFLEHVLSAEAGSKARKQTALRITLAKFPYVKTLDGFDFGFQPSVDKAQVELLAQSRYVANGDNVVLLGPPGVGKTRTPSS
jgi:DNA replication protein DnaC